MPNITIYKDDLVNNSTKEFFKDSIEMMQSTTMNDQILSTFFRKCEEHLTYINKYEDSVKHPYTDNRPIEKESIYFDIKANFGVNSEPDIINKTRRDIINMLDLFLLKNSRDSLNFARKMHKYWLRTKKGLMDETVVVLINGYNQVGKDTFIDLLKTVSLESIYNISTVDKVKEAAKILGWNGEKDDNAREALHHIKMISNKHFDHSRKYIKDFVKLHSNCVIFVHCREPEELAHFKETIPLIKDGVTCKTLLIKNSRVEPANNSADKNVQNFIYDNTIFNEGDLSDLTEEAKLYLKEILK